MKNVRCQNCLPSSIGRYKNVVLIDTIFQPADHLYSTLPSVTTQGGSIITLSSPPSASQQVMGGGSQLNATMCDFFITSLHFSMPIPYQTMTIGQL